MTEDYDIRSLRRAWLEVRAPRWGHTFDQKDHEASQVLGLLRRAYREAHPERELLLPVLHPRRRRQRRLPALRLAAVVVAILGTWWLRRESDTTASDTTASDTTASDTTASDTTASDTTASDTTASMPATGPALSSAARVVCATEDRTEIVSGRVRLTLVAASPDPAPESREPNEPSSRRKQGNARRRGDVGISCGR